MVAGGSEAPLARMVVAGFNAMGALSTRNDDPAAASRPFDAERDGFVLGEGGAALILESADHAARRGAMVLADLTGYATTDDANHMVQPAPGGSGAARAMTLALGAAGLQPNDIGYINAHGTSTQLNEKFETQAIKAAFGEAAYRVPISSTKSRPDTFWARPGRWRPRWRSWPSSMGCCRRPSTRLPPIPNVIWTMCQTSPGEPISSTR